MSFNLIYRRNKLKSNNFKPIIKFFMEEEEEEEKYPEEHHPPIAEYQEEEEEEEESTIQLLEELMKEVKKKKNKRTLELWIQQRRKKIRELTQSDMGELLDFINDKFYQDY